MVWFPTEGTTLEAEVAQLSVMVWVSRVRVGSAPLFFLLFLLLLSPPPFSSSSSNTATWLNYSFLLPSKFSFIFKLLSYFYYLLSHFLFIPTLLHFSFSTLTYLAFFPSIHIFLLVSIPSSQLRHPTFTISPSTFQPPSSVQFTNTLSANTNVQTHHLKKQLLITTATKTKTKTCIQTRT